MSDIRHTPGPWRVFTSKDGSKLIGVGDIGAEGITDCGFGVWRGGDAEAIANARLIAASPDLFDLAKLFERRVEYEIRRSRNEDDEEGARLKTITLNMIRAVIAKAEGTTAAA